MEEIVESYREAHISLQSFLVENFSIALRGPKKELFPQSLYEDLYGNFESDLLRKIKERAKKEHRPYD